jgi:hypothetical protein
VRGGSDQKLQGRGRLAPLRRWTDDELREVQLSLARLVVNNPALVSDDERVEALGEILEVLDLRRKIG